MSSRQPLTTPVWHLVKLMSPNLATQLLLGCFMSFPGASMDVLLGKFQWTVADFGMAALVQGAFGLLGNTFANIRIPHRTNLLPDLKLSQALVLFGVLLVYAWEFITSPLPFALPPQFRLVGFAFIGFGIGLQAIINNTCALRTAQPASALMLVAFTFTFGALFFPLITGFFLASLSSFSEHNWKVILIPVFFLAALNMFWPLNLQSKTPLAQANQNPAGKGDFLNLPLPASVTPHRITPYALGFLLFLYMGIEINLTNNLALHGIESLSIPNALARFASSALWLGILLSRLGTSFFPLNPSRFPTWTWVASFPLTLLLFVIPHFYLPPTAWLALIFVIGVTLGPFYGFIVGQASHLYTGANMARHAATIATIGSGGFIVMPFLFGKIANQSSLKGGFLFVAATAALLLIGAAIMARVNAPAAAISNKD